MADPMQRALELAQQALLRSAPNPRVGCVIVAADGVLLGEGSTQQAGAAHAEVMALRDAASRGLSVAGACAYVTLEPCSHTGRTGPCCEALIDAGISRVVASIADPNPLVAGRGLARLRSAGIAVQVGPGAKQSRQLNIGFFSRMLRGTPWVRLKLAASLDGRTALDNGQSQWITSEPARADGHAWRARACAVLSGIGTVLEDDPWLDVRLLDTPRQPTLVLVDSRLQTPPQARLFEPARPVWIYWAAQDPAGEAALRARGALLRHLSDGRPEPKVDLQALLRDLGRREINELHVEAGHKLNGSLLRAGLVDELLLYLAPKLVGPGRAMASLAPLNSLADALALEFSSAQMIGPDLRILASIPGRDRF